MQTIDTLAANAIETYKLARSKGISVNDSIYSVLRPMRKAMGDVPNPEIDLDMAYAMTIGLLHEPVSQDLNCVVINPLLAPEAVALWVDKLTNDFTRISSPIESGGKGHSLMDAFKIVNGAIRMYPQFPPQETLVCAVAMIEFASAIGSAAKDIMADMAKS